MDSITKNGLQSLAVDSWNGEGDLATFTAGFVAAWSERSTLANVTLEAKDKRIAELEAALSLCREQAYTAWQDAIAIQKNGGSTGGVFNVAREGLVDVIETVKSVLGSEA